ncbi:MAG TPA: hypothetical protein VFV94_00800 [Polyangiaceae bacterium]|nr:hypothetical protein [Polyangiaceae bacterium]
MTGELRRRALRVALVALVVRLGVVAVAAGRFPPADDGTFYQEIAARIARGLGYTWAWPDGSVTFAANYPVGYPALLGVFYAVTGPRVGVAMLLNAVLGAVASGAAVVLGSRHGEGRSGVPAGLVVAFEPALVLYTPALMTEAFAGELVVIAAALATGERGRRALWRIAAGLVMGVATLVRPELLLLAPVVGALAEWRAPEARRAVLAAALVTGTALAACAPWTLRNCARLDRCAFVSANAGQNLLIGTSPLGRGGWVGLDQLGVPEACRTEWGEGGKDRCFGHAARAIIAADPLGWLALVPAKLAVTFDYGTAAAYYLAKSNPALVGENAKRLIGALELVGQRVLLVLAALALGSAPGPRVALRRWLGRLAAVFALLPPAWVGFVVLVVLGLTLGKSLWKWPAAALSVGAVLATLLTHALFFGAGRYVLVCLPALGVLAGTGPLAMRLGSGVGARRAD